MSRVALLLLPGLLGLGLSSRASAAEPSGCIACHLDEAKLLKNLTVSTSKKSALQSGAG